MEAASPLWDMGTSKQDMGAKKPQAWRDEKRLHRRGSLCNDTKKAGTSEWEGARLGMGKPRLLGPRWECRVPGASMAHPHSEAMGSH